MREVGNLAGESVESMENTTWEYRHMALLEF